MIRVKKNMKSPYRNNVTHQLLLAGPKDQPYKTYLL
uniref:Uncharacterized protein n=1 Tax=Arundo donax TaxID=35708 RepID=A0A0A9ACZ3_ARUDO